MKIANREEIIKAAKKLPRIKRGEIKFLYENDSWDGPLEGVCSWRDKEHYFVCIEEEPLNYETYSPGLSRRFALIGLTEEQENEERKWHQLFEEKVGKHATYGNSNELIKSPLQPKEIQKEFYDAYEKVTPWNINPSQIIGWFTLK